MGDERVSDEDVLRDLLACAQAWEPDARLIGNVRAGDAVRALTTLAAKDEELATLRAERNEARTAHDMAEREASRLHTKVGEYQREAVRLRARDERTARVIEAADRAVDCCAALYAVSDTETGDAIDRYRAARATLDDATAAKPRGACSWCSGSGEVTLVLHGERIVVQCSPCDGTGHSKRAHPPKPRADAAEAREAVLTCADCGETRRGVGLTGATFVCRHCLSLRATDAAGMCAAHRRCDLDDVLDAAEIEAAHDLGAACGASVEERAAEPVCTVCNDTHSVPVPEERAARGDTGPFGDGTWMCTSCPTPCQDCRASGRGAYCETTPCPCECHRERGEWRAGDRVVHKSGARGVVSDVQAPGTSAEVMVIACGPRGGDRHRMPPSMVAAYGWRREEGDPRSERHRDRAQQRIGARLSMPPELAAAELRAISEAERAEEESER